MKNILFREISKICQRYGWSLSITEQSQDSIFIDFERRTESNEVFSVSVEATDGIKQICEELFDFIETFDSQYSAGKWLESQGSFSPSFYFKTIRELEDMKTRIWHLAIEISFIEERLGEILRFLSASLN